MSLQGPMLTRRRQNAAGAAICAALLAYGYYLEHVAGLAPCPLCILQRMAFAGLAVLFVAAALHGPARRGAAVYAALLGVTGAAGAGLAVRHLYIQTRPAEGLGGCGPGLDYIVDTFGPLEAAEVILRGSGECASVDWTFLGLSLPGWALVWFVLLGVAGVAGNVSRRLGP